MSMTGRQWALTIVGMLVIIPVAQYLGRSLGEARNALDLESSVLEPDFSQTRVIVSHQAADGVSEADFDQHFLTNLESWVVERTLANAEKYFDSALVPENLRKVSGESIYVDQYGHRLAVVRIRIGGTNPNATIFGVLGDELIRIGCFDRSGANVAIMDGPCSEKIEEIFGDPLETANG